jgi:hypothetical protein
MAALLLILVCIACIVAAYALWRSCEQPPAELDPEARVKAAIRLYAIRRRLEVALTRSEIRQNAERTRRDIAEALKDGQE